MTKTRGYSLNWPLVAAALGGVIIGGTVLQLANGSGKAQTEAIVRDYILEHPEILPEAMKRLQAKENGQLVARNQPALEIPFHGAWAGAEKPDVTLVMFTDYSCGFCRTSVSDIDRLLSEDKKLMVVWREIPILGPGSEAASRAALAAAQQGHYLDFHRRMFTDGPPDEASIARVLQATSVTASADTDGAITQEIEKNLALARTLGLTGTPTFVIGDKILQGAVGYKAIKDAIEQQRKAA